MNNKISKAKLIFRIQEKLDFKIKKSHILAVLTIFMEEMIKDLIQKKTVKIKNFGVFETKRTKARMHMSVVSKTMNMSKGRNFLNFKLENKIIKFIKNNLDNSKTFNS